MEVSVELVLHYLHIRTYVQLSVTAILFMWLYVIGTNMTKDLREQQVKHLHIHTLVLGEECLNN